MMITADEQAGKKGVGEIPVDRAKEISEGKWREYEKENSRLGTLIFPAAEAMLFAGLLAACIVLASGTESGPPEGGIGWLPLGIGGIAVFTLELARRHAEGGMRLTAHWGMNLAILAGVAWPVVSSDKILGLGGGGAAALAEVPPLEGCLLILHTLLALHVLVALLFTGLGAVRLFRGTEGAAEAAAKAEILWCLALAVGAGSAMVGQ